MAKNSKIEWTDATFNPWMGCTKVSPACDNCYAAVSTPARTRGIQWGAGQPRERTTPLYWDQAKRWNSTPFFQCLICGRRGTENELAKSRSDECQCWSYMKPARRRVFCASLADVFDNEVPVEWRADLLMLIRATPALDWLLLTKRIGTVPRLLAEAADFLRVSGRLDGWDWLNDWICGSAPRQVWLGATIANREEMLRDGPKLKMAPARVRFWSVEPMLGDLGEIPNVLTPDWLIAGGESGAKARPMHPDWARGLRDQCAAVGVPFLFKQWGEWYPWREEPLGVKHSAEIYVEPDGQVVEHTTRCDAALMLRVGKDASGRLLDGRTHDGYPA
jgi:protein gp37